MIDYTPIRAFKPVEKDMTREITSEDIKRAERFDADHRPKPLGVIREQE